ncbi:hypothetical protein, partial [Streptomyces sp. NPDC059616]|uniref:hypothetical protein n=1 Tax=Streptomyces sp. NPDC059616 TaxID=3346886 RepID=UPI00367D2C47
RRAAPARGRAGAPRSGARGPGGPPPADEVNEIAKVTGGGGYQVIDPAEIQVVILQAIMTAGQSSHATQD